MSVKKYLENSKIRSDALKGIITGLHLKYPEGATITELYHESLGTRKNFRLALIRAADNTKTRRQNKTPRLTILNPGEKPMIAKMLDSVYEEIRKYESEEEIEYYEDTKMPIAKFETEEEEMKVKEWVEEAKNHGEELGKKLDPIAEILEGEIEDFDIEYKADNSDIEELEDVEEAIEENQAEEGRICLTCGKAFKPKNHFQKYCKKTCVPKK